MNEVELVRKTHRLNCLSCHEKKGNSCFHAIPSLLVEEGIAPAVRKYLPMRNKQYARAPERSIVRIRLHIADRGWAGEVSYDRS
jgi:hypothetical protein